MADTLVSLRAQILALEDQLEAKEAPRTMQVWEGGMGDRLTRTLATDEAEAIGNIVEKDPLLLSIGCFAYPVPDVEGYPVVAIVPRDFVTGTERRNGTVLD